MNYNFTYQDQRILRGPKSVRRLAAVSLAVLLACCLSCSAGRFRTRNNPRLKEVKQIVLEVPNYSNFNQVGNNEIVTADSVMITNYYVSKASYEDVREFYLDRLSQKGWTLAEEKPLLVWGTDYGVKKLVFLKGEFMIAIQYEGTRATSVGRNFALSYAWDSPEFRQRVRNINSV